MSDEQPHDPGNPPVAPRSSRSRRRWWDPTYEKPSEFNGDERAPCDLSPSEQLHALYRDNPPGDA